MIEIARVAGAQGIKGDIKVQLYSDNFDEFCARGFAYIQKDGGYSRIGYEPVRVTPPFAILHVVGVDTRNDAEMLRNEALYIKREELEAPEPGEHYIADIVGITVMAGGKKLGVLKDVLQYGAADVYVVKGDRNFMFPALKRVILRTDISAGVMELDETALGEVAVYDDV